MSRYPVSNLTVGDNCADLAQMSKASQHRKELELLLRVLKGINIKVVLEIGVDKGYSMETWNTAFSPVVIVGCDIHNIVELTDLKDKVVVGDSKEPKTVNEIIKRLEGNMIDMLFIDGDHMRPGVDLDWSNFSQWVRKGGVVIFHDIALTQHPLVQVYELWDELKTKYDSMEIICLGGMGIGILFI